ncbi:hypothetical protein [Edaphocola aurantiacus]|jgi:hypothetical protein|uniref:hypothetical protein n=1 Tax=Edaphocola aurantiacus TaxID=2601682 RepID=UPI001C94F1AA|nr:hypothetical protein [Edaphocola aurantiacus]
MPQSHLKINTLDHKKPLRILANIVSVVCHPVFMPVIMTFVLYGINRVSFGNITMKTMYSWTGILALNTIFFPLVTIFLLKRLNFIESIKLNNSKDRIIPLIATMIFYFWAYMVFKNMKQPEVAPQVLRIFLLGNFWGIIAIFMVNIFKKVSMHAAAAGGMIGILIVAMIVSRVNLFMPLMISLLIAGIIGSARLVLRAHTNGEIGLGYILGILAQLASYFYITRLINIFD